jgi:hypothetical protein
MVKEVVGRVVGGMVVVGRVEEEREGEGRVEGEREGEERVGMGMEEKVGEVEAREGSVEDSSCMWLQAQVHR